MTLDWKDQVDFFVNGSRGVHYPGIYTRSLADDFAKGTLDAEVMDYVSAENLTNADYEYYPGYPMPGIMWYVGCKFKF